MSEFGDRLRARRLAAHLRQCDFVDAGITQSQLSLIENGDVEPSAAKIESIATVLNLAAVDLVGGTELEDGYVAARLTSAEVMAIVEAARLSRSERLVGVQESYRRVQGLWEFVHDDGAIHPVSVDDETRYQHAARIFRRMLDTARECDRALAGRMFVPHSLIGESGTPPAQARMLFRRSEAYLRSLVLEYPEADDESRRGEICELIGLRRIDDYFRGRATDISPDEAV